jgi:hypothetical protein
LGLLPRAVSTYKSHAIILRIAEILPGLFKLVFTPISRQIPSEADQHLAQGRVDVKVKLTMDVVIRELAKVRLIPAAQACHDINARCMNRHDPDDVWQA